MAWPSAAKMFAGILVIFRFPAACGCLYIFLMSLSPASECVCMYFFHLNDLFIFAQAFGLSAATHIP